MSTKARYALKQRNFNKEQKSPKMKQLKLHLEETPSNIGTLGKIPEIKLKDCKKQHNVVRKLSVMEEKYENDNNNKEKLNFKSKDMPNKTPEISSDESDSDDENISQEKIKKRHELLHKRKMEMVEKLNIANIASSIQKPKPPKSVKLNKIATRKIKEKNIEPRRVSLRIRSKDKKSFNEADLQTLAIEAALEAKPEKPRVTGKQYPLVGIGFGDNECRTEEDDKYFVSHDNFFSDISLKNKSQNEIPEPNLSFDDEEYVKILKKMTVSDESVTKVVPGRIFSLAIHPRVDKTLIATGDKDGYLGIWDVNNKTDLNGGVYQFKPHSAPISNLKFSPANSNKLFMCGYDGLLRYADLNSLVFSEAIVDDESYSLSGFDFLHINQDDCLVASTYEGGVLVIDNREKKCDGIRHFQAFDKRTKSISVNPNDSNYICTAHHKGEIRIFDLRKFSLTKKSCKPVVAITPHANSVNSAFFSPWTGNRIVSVSYDDRIKMFNTESISEGSLPMIASTYHDNHTGRWISSFRSVWHPFQDGIFAIGSMYKPQRQIDIYNSNLTKIHSLADPNLSTIAAVVQFHPSQHIIAGGNSSGKVYVFK